MNTTWVTFTATVPDWAVPELSRHANELVARASATPLPAADDPFSPAAVRRAWTEINYPLWRPFLKALAAKSLQVDSGRVSWNDLVEIVGAHSTKLSGAVGAAHKALHGRLPFERRRGGNTSIFIMRSDVAQMILGFVRESTDESLRMAGE